MSRCDFCLIVAGQAPTELVGENERAIAFMDINPVNDGHVLVVSKAHAEDMWDLGPEDGIAVWSLTQQLARAIREALEPDGLTMFQANRRAGWQDVFHFHLHLIPRWLGDDLVKPWTPSDAKRPGIPAAAEKIRAALA